MGAIFCDMDEVVARTHLSQRTLRRNYIPNRLPPQVFHPSHSILGGIRHKLHFLVRDVERLVGELEKERKENPHALGYIRRKAVHEESK